MIRKSTDLCNKDSNQCHMGFWWENSIHYCAVNNLIDGTVFVIRYICVIIKIRHSLQYNYNTLIFTAKKRGNLAFDCSNITFQRGISGVICMSQHRTALFELIVYHDFFGAFDPM